MTGKLMLLEEVLAPFEGALIPFDFDWLIGTLFKNSVRVRRSGDHDVVNTKMKSEVRGPIGPYEILMAKLPDLFGSH